MGLRFYGLSFKELQSVAFEYAQQNGIANPFDQSSRLAGRDWVSGFLKRNSTLSLKTPEAMSLGRAIGFNQPQWNIYQDNLQSLYEKYHFTPARIYYMDESGLSTVPTKLRKVIGEKGRNASKIVSAERGITVTVICCMSAGGNFVPPVLIYPRKRQNEALLHGAPFGTIQMCSDSGFINSDLFVDWLKHFQASVKSSQQDPVLLVVDNHSSHISLASVLYCREHSIHVTSLPPHSSHKTQPLDVCFYGPLKVHYATAAENWMAMHPGRAISQYQVAELLNVAYSRVASVGIASKAFAAVGIWPLNRSIFTADDFVGSLVTDRPEPPSSQNVESMPAFVSHHQDESRDRPTTDPVVTPSPDETPAAPEASCDNHNCTTDDGVHGEAAVTITLNVPAQNADFTSSNLTGSSGSVFLSDSRRIVDSAGKSQTVSTCSTPSQADRVSLNLLDSAGPSPLPFT